MRKKKTISILLVLCLLCGICSFAHANGGAYADCAEFIIQKVPTPTVASIGGEWGVIGLARGGATMPEGYFDIYYSNVEDTLKAAEGVLHSVKYTEYSRVALALTAIGKDPSNVAGYDLLSPLADYDKVLKQGINGPIWALIALDSGDYDMPVAPTGATQATREKYVEAILSAQLGIGGWNLAGSEDREPDPDVTGMALQALAAYRGDKRVDSAIEKALGWLSSAQDAEGGYSLYGEANSESVVQVIVALCALDINPDNSLFVKNGHSLMDNLLSYRCTDGGFMHKAGGKTNLMASEQALYCLAAVERSEKGQTSLYDMSDVSIRDEAFGLEDKHEDIRKTEVTAPGMSFEDIAGHGDRAAIEALASREIINGVGEGLFDPDVTMTRAQFAAITVRALGLQSRENSAFSDITPGKWYSGFIGSANTYGIVNGRGEGIFDPGGTISRMEAAALVARCAKLCGMDTDVRSADKLLAEFSDGGDVPAWVKADLAFCIESGIMDFVDESICCREPILRCEIASMVYNMLSLARLL